MRNNKLTHCSHAHKPQEGSGVNVSPYPCSVQFSVLVHVLHCMYTVPTLIKTVSVSTLFLLNHYMVFNSEDNTLEKLINEGKNSDMRCLAICVERP